MCERNISPLPLARPQQGTGQATQACALTRNQTLRVGAQSTEPHQPGQGDFLKVNS